MADAKSYCSINKEFMIEEIENVKDWLCSNIFLSNGKINEESLFVLFGREQILKKDAKSSVSYRQKGNSIFKKKKHSLEDHLDIWKNYSQSIACAPNSSTELAQAYYNRASFFCHIQEYKESVKDIYRALMLEKCHDELKLKLNNLKSQCSEKLKEQGIGKKLSDNLMVIPGPEAEIPKKNKFIPCASDAVTISYDKNFGRCVVATRDIRPGELIVKEKCFSKFISRGEYPRYCFHCCKVAYSSFPCENCAYAMFCSEACKKEASEYHKIECMLLNNMDLRKKLVPCMIFGIRIFVKILKEFTSIKDLKAHVQKIDNCTDPLEMGFTDGIFQSDISTSILTLSIAAINRTPMVRDVTTRLMTCCLYFLGLETNIFGKKLKSSFELLLNDDALFVGALLSRLHHIIATNASMLSEGVSKIRRRYRDYLEDLRERYGPETSRTGNYMGIQGGESISSFSSLFNHSCVQNIGSFIMDNNESLYFAIQPIKKGSQLRFSYTGGLLETSRLGRIKSLSEGYSFNCKCDACEEDWPIYCEAPKLDANSIPDSIFAPTKASNYETVLNNSLLMLEKYLKRDKKFCHKEIYKMYSVVLDLYYARFVQWCHIPHCC